MIRRCFRIFRQDLGKLLLSRVTVTGVGRCLVTLQGTAFNRELCTAVMYLINFGRIGSRHGLGLIHRSDP